MNTKSYKVPAKFYRDHIGRDCGQSGKVVQRTKNYYIVELDQLAYEDLLSDCLYYIECADQFDPRLPGLVASAKATAKALTNQPTERG